MDWFSVDKDGLAKLLERKGKAFVLYELLQNAWDTMAQNITVSLNPVPGRPQVEVVVEDDNADGFTNLKHAFTLFAESEKKGDPSKRGRFNLGEKLVLALCEEAEIKSTKGSVRFDKNGRTETRSKTEKGSRFWGIVRMTRDELAETLKSLDLLIAPDNMTTTVNGQGMVVRPILHSLQVKLPTEYADSEGVLRRSSQSTMVSTHPIYDDEKPWLYEMGIPVVELDGGEPWHVNVHQKIPLNFDRDNVTPAYLRTLRVHLLNATHNDLKEEHLEKEWVTMGSSNPDVSKDAMESVLDGRFGTSRASFDPNDREANKQLMNEGFTIVSGGSLSAHQWANAKDMVLLQPAGRIRPSGVKYSEDGPSEKVIHPTDYSEGMTRMVAYLGAFSALLLGRRVGIEIVNEFGRPQTAWFMDAPSAPLIKFNLARLGHAWFDGTITDSHHELLVHELAHAKVSDHLTREFADEVGRLGCKLARLALNRPEIFRFATPPRSV